MTQEKLLIQLRVPEDLYDRLMAVGHDLAKVRPGLDFSVSALVRAAIAAWVEPPDPAVVELRLPALPDETAAALCALLETAAAQARAAEPGPAADTLDAIADAVTTRYLPAVLRHVRERNKGDLQG